MPDHDLLSIGQGLMDDFSTEDHLEFLSFEAGRAADENRQVSNALRDYLSNSPFRRRSERAELNFLEEKNSPKRNRKRISQLKRDFNLAERERVVFEGIAEPEFRRVHQAIIDERDKPSLEKSILAERAKPEDLERYVLERIPFISGGAQFKRTIEHTEAVERVNAGEASRNDFRIVAKELVHGERLAERGFWRKVTDTATSIPGFAGEFILTGGAFTGAKRVAQKALTKSLGKLATKRLGKIAIGTAGFSAGVIAQTIANPQLVGAEAARRMGPEFHLDIDDAGRLKLIIDKKGDGFAEALGKGFVHGLIQLGGERSGGMIKHLPGATKVQAVKAAITRRWLKLNPKKSVTDLADQIAKKAGWNGVLGEVFEERVTEAASAAVGLEEFPHGLDLKFAEQLLIEGLAFSVPGAATIAASQVGNATQKSKDAIVKALEGRQDKRFRRDLFKSAVESPETAAEFMATEPDFAQEIITSAETNEQTPGVPSRRLVNSIFKAKTTAEDRKQLLNNLLAAREDVPAQGEPSPTPTPPPPGGRRCP